MRNDGLQKDETQLNWADDKLGIQEKVIGFANILKQERYSQNSTSKVYSISAEFGIGKTFFCTKLHDVLKQDGVPVSMMNIWKMDFYNNPLMPILIKLQETYRNTKSTKQKIPMPTKILNWCKSGLAGFSIKANIQDIIEMEFDGDKTVKCNEKLQQNSKASDIYTEYEQIETELENLKKFLRKWTETIDKPVVVIIDELDRCRPDYAVKTLEVLKHFFDIPGFVFVLAIDEEQLKSSVETLFGTKNFDGYKRKFINNSFLLPNPDKVSFTNFLYQRSDIATVIQTIQANQKDLIFKANFMNLSSPLGQQIKRFNNYQTIDHIIINYFAYYSYWFNFTLRHMEQIFDRFVLFTKSILSNDELFSPDLAVFLVCLHEFDLQIYNQVKNHPCITENNKSVFVCVSEIARKLYDIKYINHFGEQRTDILPLMPKIENFSTLGPSDAQQIIIHHNVDRFFKRTDNDSKKWLREEIIYDHKRIIDNNERLVMIKYTDDDKRWGGKQDFDNVTSFNLDAFKQSYFDKMDFISNFK